jgi:thiamine-monophosphate kinase
MRRTPKTGIEATLIRRILHALGASGKLRDIEVGPGDDSAVISPRPDAQWVVTCDSFFEQTHFLPRFHPPDVVGFKALARAVSDLAAMGATPRFFLVALALPPSRTGKWLDEMLAGMARAARRLGIQLVGGDTSAQPSASLCLTVIGEVWRGMAVARSGARPGDHLFVSGMLGEARLGLELVQRGMARRPSLRSFLRRHYYPQPRIELGRWLARHRLVTAMIDLSDGLSTDLHNLCRASGVGALIRSEQVPRANLPVVRGIEMNALQLALHGGDDYELLFAVPARHVPRIPARFEAIRLTDIGEVTRDRAILQQDARGRRKILHAQGWDPFRSK